MTTNRCCDDTCHDDCNKHCDKDCTRCKRGKRGKRGHRGHEGPPGPPGPASGGLLKFSGQALAVEGDGGGIGPALSTKSTKVIVAPRVVGSVVSFLADMGVGFSPGVVLGLPPHYPVAVPHKLRNLAVNVLDVIVPLTGSILVELLQNGVAVPGFAVTYGPGQTGIRSAVAGPYPFAGPPNPDTFDLRVTCTNLESLEVDVVNLSATVGVE